MTAITVMYCASGDTFRPSLAEVESGIFFDDKGEPGDIGIRGLYRGRPTPYGHARKEWPVGEIDLVSPNTEFFDEMTRLDVASASAGADDREFNMMVTYGNQCNFEFSPTFLKSLALLDLTVTISCYSDYEEEVQDHQA